MSSCPRSSSSTRSCSAGFWSGFGALANFTLADSEIETQGDPLEGEPLLGVSKYSYNLGLLYEKFGVTSRLVYTHRSDYNEFLIGGALSPVGNGAVFNGVRSNGRLDLSVGYDLTQYVTVSVDGDESHPGALLQLLRHDGVPP